MTRSDVYFAAIAAPILLSVAISYLARHRSQTFRAYFWADNQLNASQSANLYISTSLALGNAIIFFVWAGYTAGISALWIQIAWCASFWLARNFAGQIARRSAVGTLHGSLARSFGPHAGVAAAIASIIGFTFNLGWEVVAGVKVFSTISPRGPFLFFLTIALATIAAAYTMLGGLRGNLRANQVQNALSYIALLILCGALLIRQYQTAGLGNALTTAWNPFSSELIVLLGVGGLIANVVVSIAWQFVDMSGWQNLGATNHADQTPKTALLKSMVWVFFFPGFFSVLAGILLRDVPNLTPDTILVSLIEVASTNNIVLFFVTAGLIAAMLSTIDGFLLAASQAFTLDLLNRRKLPPSVSIASANIDKDSEYRLLAHARTFALLLAVIGSTGVYALNAWGLDLFNIVYVTYSSQVALFPAVLLMLLGWSVTPNSGAMSIIIGIISGLAVAGIGFGTGSNLLLTWAPVVGLVAACVPILNARPKSTPDMEEV